MTLHVLVAGSAGLEANVGRALLWAQSHGATTIDREVTESGVVALASTGGSMARIRRTIDGTVMSLGLHHVAGGAELAAGRVPEGTVAFFAAAGRLLAGSGGGNQRLFVARIGEGLLVSTHVGALVAALGNDAVLDRSYEDFLLGFGFLPDRRTLFRGVESLPRPGTIDLISGTVSLPAPIADESEAAAAENLAELLCEIVDEQAGAASSVGVLLGGFDSALVAAALNRTGRKVHTFTFGFGEAGFEQRNIEAAVAAADAHHQWVRFTPERIGAALIDLPARMNQPSPQPHYQIQTIIAAEVAQSAGAEVIFTGDGCDALFAAYPTINTRAAVNVQLQRLPAPLRRALLSLLATESIERQFGHVARVARSSLRASLMGAPASQHLPTQYLDNISLGRLRTDPAPPQAETIAQIRLRLAASSSQLTPARLAVDGNSLTGQSQSKVEGMALRTGLPVQSPFTHPRFRAAFAALPLNQQVPSARMGGAEGKPVLQQAAARAGLLPDIVIYQKKQAPTESPIDFWYAGPLRSTVFALLDDLPFEVNWDFVEDILSPKRAEDYYRRRIAISRHAFQAIGLLSSYASFARMTP